MLSSTVSPIEAAKKLATKQLQKSHTSLVLHSYKDNKGENIYWRIRIDYYDGSKWIRPMHQDENGQYRLCEPLQFKKELKPLYGLDLLSAYPKAIVFIVEGEKCADSLNNFFSQQKVASEYVATTSGGATSDDSADWKPLKGREGLIWPDHDESGEQYAERVVKKLRTVGCDVQLLDISQFELQNGGDCVDFLHTHSGITIDELIRLFSYKERIDSGYVTSPSLTPIPLPTLPAVMPFDAEKMLPDAIRDYIVDVADRQQSRIDFAAISSICGLSAVLGRKVQVRPKQNDDWTVTANQWGAIIGRPSAMKSPSMKEVLKPLREIEQQALKCFEEEVKEYEARTHLAEIEMTHAKTIAKSKLKIGDKEGALNLLANARFDDSLPKRHRLIVNDATVEKLGELLNENPNGLILVRDELAGWLSKLMQEEHQAERAFLLECFDGNGHFVYDRIQRGTIDIKNCILSVIGGIQPSKISPLVRGALKGTSDDGLVQRLQLAVWPEDKGSWIWRDRAPNKQAYDRYQDIFKQLHLLDFNGDDEEPSYLRFSLAAQELFIDWMNKIQTLARSDEIHPVLESHLLKMPQTIAGLALLFELIDGGRESIGVTALQRALVWAEYLQTHAERLYSVIGRSEIEGARLILKRRNKLPECFTTRVVQRKGWPGLDNVAVVNESLECLVEHNYLQAVPVPSDILGGRPTIQYCWNT